MDTDDSLPEANVVQCLSDSPAQDRGCGNDLLVAVDHDASIGITGVDCDNGLCQSGSP